MSSPAFIGVPAPGAAYTARYLHHGEHPTTVVRLLRRMWVETFTGDTDAMAAALLEHDWSDLDIHSPGRRGHLPPPVPGIGNPAPSHDRGLRAGQLGETIDGFLEWIYLINPDQHMVVVYEATCHARWLRHSLHHLDPVEDLFVVEPDPDGGHEPAMTVCTVCGAVDEIEHLELPSMVGYGSDTSTTCQRCGSSVTTDPMFGAHVTRRPRPAQPAVPPHQRDTPQPRPAHEEQPGNGVHGDSSNIDVNALGQAGSRQHPGTTEINDHTRLGYME